MQICIYFSKSATVQLGLTMKRQGLLLEIANINANKRIMMYITW